MDALSLDQSLSPDIVHDMLTVSTSPLIMTSRVCVCVVAHRLEGRA